jgi:hypothetical protein
VYRRGGGGNLLDVYRRGECGNTMPNSFQDYGVEIGRVKLYPLSFYQTLKSGLSYLNIKTHCAQYKLKDIPVRILSNNSPHLPRIGSWINLSVENLRKR